MAQNMAHLGGAKQVKTMFGRNRCQRLVRAYLANTELEPRDTQEDRRLLLMVGLGAVEEMVARDMAWLKSVANESGTAWLAEDRSRMKRLQIMVIRVRAFAIMCGLKVPTTKHRRAA